MNFRFIYYRVYILKEQSTTTSIQQLANTVMKNPQETLQKTFTLVAPAT